MLLDRWNWRFGAQSRRGTAGSCQLERAFSEAAKLSPEEQDAFARWMLEELADEERWQKSFDQSADLLEHMADEALAEYRAGKTDS